MRTTYFTNRFLKLAAVTLAAAAAAGTGDALAKVPCGDFGECKVLVEVNASDGDIGFHFLGDGEDLLSARIKDPNNELIFFEKAAGPLADQKLTETFVESAEPVCRAELAEDPEEVVVNLVQFLTRWTPGPYRFIGKDEEGESARGRTRLTFKLPAAPRDVAFENGIVSWEAGNDLGECATSNRLAKLVADGVLPKHPKDVRVMAWEIAFEADDESGLRHELRVPGNIAVKEVAVPQEFLDALPPDTPAKIEVGAIGSTDNATFTEVGDICVNEVNGCASED